MLDFILKNLFGVVCVVLPLLGSVAYLTLFERKFIAAMQLRRGPNVNGPFGVLQPLLDGAKLLLKEQIVPARADRVTFLLAPVITFFLALSAWAVIPISAYQFFSNINVGVMYLLAISALGIYGVVIAGWSSGSKYPFLGAIRSASQMISYELSMSTVVICVLMFSKSLNLLEIVQYQAHNGWFALRLFPLFVVFLICIIAETNRHPFDLPEAEAELVAGFNVEYSSMSFAAFFLGEYANMIMMSSFTVILFLGGWMPIIPSLEFVPGAFWFVLKVVLILFVFVWVRASLPRYRYDQIMKLGWKVLLPVSILGLICCAVVVFVRQI